MSKRMVDERLLKDALELAEQSYIIPNSFIDLRKRMEVIKKLREALNAGQGTQDEAAPIG